MIPLPTRATRTDTPFPSTTLFRSPNGIPARLIEAWLDRRFVLVSHALQIEEIRDVSRRDKIRALVRTAEVGRLVNQIGLVADIPADLPHVRRSPDPTDRKSVVLGQIGSLRVDLG